MSKKLQTIIATVAVFGLAVMLGCASFQDAVIPCYVAPATTEYADTNSTSIMPYTTLFDAKRVGMKMDFVHIRNQAIDRMQYNYGKGINAFHISAGEELRATLFSPTGAIGLLLPASLGTIIGGAYIKRSKDKTKEEYEIAGKMTPEDFVKNGA